MGAGLALVAAALWSAGGGGPWWSGLQALAAPALREAPGPGALAAVLLLAPLASAGLGALYGWLTRRLERLETLVLAPSLGLILWAVHDALSGRAGQLVPAWPAWLTLTALLLVTIGWGLGASVAKRRQRSLDEGPHLPVMS